MSDQYIHHTSEQITVGGLVLSNQCGSFLACENHKIKGSSKYNYFLLRICVASVGKSFPSRHPKGINFPMFDESGSILGTLPSAFNLKNITTFVFESIKYHTRNRLTSPFMKISSNPQCIVYLCHQIVNFAITHSDTCTVLNRGLTTNENGDLG